MRKNSSPSHRLAASLTSTLVFALVVLAVVGGCTSDSANPVGADLQETSIDVTLAELTEDQFEDFGVLAVQDPDVPLDETEVLYLGTSDTEQSAILVDYDFSFLDHPDNEELLPFLTRENISSVKIQLIMLEWYTPWRGGSSPSDPGYIPPVVKEWPGAPKYLDVHQLVAPYDTLSYPGAEPQYIPNPISKPRDEPYTDSLVWIECEKMIVLEWLENRAEVGIIIREGTGSTPGILGFTSKEMKHGGSTLPQEHEDVTLGVALIIGLYEQPDSWPSGQQFLTVSPLADVSTWHELQDPYTDPDEGVMVRTHLRSYPMLRFNLDSLPPNARINRANLVVYNDTSRSEGHRTVLTCSELPPAFAPPGVTNIDLGDFEPEIYFLHGSGSWQPEHLSEHELKFNVTTSIQRYVNSVYEGERGFLLAAGEFFFASFNSNPDPDFWFTKWIFFGAAADSALRPRLEISYTLLDELSDPEGTR